MGARPRLRGWAATTLCALLATGPGVSTHARPDAPTPAQCGAIPSPDDALRRLNAARNRGAMCRRPGDVSVAAPLTWNASLAAVAAAQAHDMAVLNHLGHRDRQGRGLAERLAAIGYRFSAAVENAAVGYPSLDAVVAAWIASEAHCANLMNAAVRELGLACADGGGGGGATEDRYWILVLGAPPRSR